MVFVLGCKMSWAKERQLHARVDSASHSMLALVLEGRLTGCGCGSPGRVDSNLVESRAWAAHFLQLYYVLATMQAAGE